MARQVVSTIVIGDEALKRKLKAMGLNVNKVLDAAVEAAAVVIEEAARSDAPGPEIDHERIKAGEYDVGPTREKWYYRFFETGTVAHKVRPDTARALRFIENGSVVFSAGHDVRGIAARPFMRPAADEHGDDAVDAAGRVFKKAVERV